MVMMMAMTLTMTMTMMVKATLTTKWGDWNGDDEDDGAGQDNLWTRTTPFRGDVSLPLSTPIIIIVNHHRLHLLVRIFLGGYLHAVTQHFLTRRNFLFLNSPRGFRRSLGQRPHFICFIDFCLLYWPFRP